MSNNLVDVCTSYGACGLLMSLHEIEWTAVGAVILLLARLVKDVPEAYYAVKSILEKRNKKKKKNVKSKR